MKIIIKKNRGKKIANILKLIANAQNKEKKNKLFNENLSRIFKK
tara:strand:- start:19 stop:150 length:132 start_codon:yes stop_codon:yes gene_type:complete